MRAVLHLFRLRHARSLYFTDSLPTGIKWMAFPPPKIGELKVLQDHRSGTSIYRKKIDTQKVYAAEVVYSRSARATLLRCRRRELADRSKTFFCDQNF